MYERRMVASMKQFSERGFEVWHFLGQQHCPTGTFDTPGFRETMADKLKGVIALHNILSARGVPYFVYSDCDVQFFGDFSGPIVEELESSGKDILFQHDGNGEFCAGFFISKVNERTLGLFRHALKVIDNHRDDQPAMNWVLHAYPDRLLPDGVPLPSVGLLSERFWTYGAKYGLWVGNADFEVPKDILVHHANWTVGLDNKEKLMDLVKQKVHELRS